MITGAEIEKQPIGRPGEHKMKGWECFNVEIDRNRRVEMEGGITIAEEKEHQRARNERLHKT